LKQSIDKRTLEVSQAEQRRLQLEAALSTVKLMSLDSGAPAPPEQSSAALLVLTKLGEVSLAIDLASEMWPKRYITSSAAVRVIDYGLAEHDPSLQREAALLLYNNVSRLDTAENQCEWPKFLEHWPLDIDPDARVTISLTLLQWIKNRPPSREDDFRVTLLKEARNLDSNQAISQVQPPAISP
jgi:hypothetical protein